MNAEPLINWIINWCKENPIKTIIILVLVFLIGLLIFNLSTECCWPSALGKTKTDGDCEIGTLIVQLRYAIGGVIAFLAVAVASDRARALDETVKVQEKGNIEERYKNAITQFGNENSSVRLAGAYGLYHLARDNKDRRENICDVLCVHIRDLTTSEVAVGKNGDGKEIKYPEKYKTKPSNEVQSILDLLTNKDKKKDFPFKSSWINLANAYLNGVDLYQAQLQGAYLWRSQLQGAELIKAQLQGAILMGAQLRGANLEKAHLQGAKLFEAQLQGANLRQAHLQEADLEKAQLQWANLFEAQLQGAVLSKLYAPGPMSLIRLEAQRNYSNVAKLQGVNLERAQLQGVNLSGIALENANLERAQLQGALLNYAQLQGTNLIQAQLQGADLFEAKLQGANLIEVQLQGANLERAQLQGANLWGAQIQISNLSRAHLEGANLIKVQFQVANLWEAQLQGADLSEAQFQGAILKEPDFKGAFTEEDIKEPVVFTIDAAINQLRARTNKESDIKNAIFSGGVTAEQLEDFKKITTKTLQNLDKIKKSSIYHRFSDFEKKMKEVERILEKNKGKSDTSIPPNSGAIMRSYPEAEAKEVIEILEGVKKKLEAVEKIPEKEWDFLKNL